MTWEKWITYSQNPLKYNITTLIINPASSRQLAFILWCDVTMLAGLDMFLTLSPSDVCSII